MRGAAGTETIMILFWEGYLGIAISVINAICALAENGYNVTVITREKDGTWPAPPAFPPGVDLVNATLARRTYSAGLKRRLQTTVGQFLDVITFYRTARQVAHRRKPKGIIGIDMHGCTIAYILARQFGIGFGYWSLELEFLRDLRNPISAGIKILEKHFSRLADFVVVQDQARGHLLAEENNFNEERLVFVPNAPRGASPRQSRSYLRDQYGFPENEIILLHAGMLYDQLLSLNVARAAKRLPANYTLVFHSAQRREPTDPYIAALARAGGDRVRLSLDPLPFEKIDDVYCGVQIGLAVYSPEHGQNFSEIASASGKLGYYLRHGIPIICNAIPSLVQFVTESGCGLAIERLDELPDAAEQVMANYGSLSTRARMWYVERMEFDRNFRPVLEKIEKWQA